MPRVMHINCSCTGSTGKIVSDIADYAATKDFESVLVAPCAPGSNPNIHYYRTSLPREQGIYRRLNSLYGFQYGFAPLSTAKIKGIIKKEKPDLIHIHCINSYMVNVYSLLRFIKKRKIPAVITNHAEFFYTGSCAWAFECDRWMTGCGQCPQKTQATGGKLWDTSAKSWKKMKQAFSGMENAVMASVSPWVKDRARKSPITVNLPHETVLNGVNTKLFRHYESHDLRQKYQIPESTKVIFHPTANFSAAEADRKGGRHVIELAKGFLGQDVLFLVAGKHPKDLDVPENMRLLGYIGDQKTLAEYYALSDVTVVTGERETFNMPVAESLCCGTPVAGFYAGGPESIALEGYSRFCEYGRPELLYHCVKDLLAQSFDKETVSAQAVGRYKAENMAEGYLAIYNKLLEKGTNTL